MPPVDAQRQRKMIDVMDPVDVVVRAGELQVGYDLPVFPPVTFEVAAGQAVAVVGANGTGKSTLLRTVVGLLEPLAGTLGAPRRGSPTSQPQPR